MIPVFLQKVGHIQNHDPLKHKIPFNSLKNMPFKQHWHYIIYSLINTSSKEEQMLQWSIFVILTGLLCNHLSYIINHHSLDYFMPHNNKVTVQVLAYLQIKMYSFIMSSIISNLKEIKMYSFIMSSIISNLKEIDYKCLKTSQFYSYAQVT